MSTAVPVPPMSKARAVLLASRPRTLPAAAAPVVLGSAIAAAEGGFRAGPALAALAGGLLIQVGTNFANDVMDFRKGTDTAERVGPTRVTLAGLLSEREVVLGAVAAFALATLCGVYLALVAGWPVIGIGVLSIVSGVLYTAGPSPLAYNGLADLFVLLFFGFAAVCGTVFVQLGRVTPLAIAGSLSAGALATAILCVNNVRDVETDRKAGRRTIPVRFGRATGVVEYTLLVLLAHLVPLLAVWARIASPWLLLAVLTLPTGLRLARTLATTTGPALNGTLARTAQLLLLHALVFSAAVAGPVLTR